MKLLASEAQCMTRIVERIIKMEEEGSILYDDAVMMLKSLSKAEVVDELELIEAIRKPKLWPAEGVKSFGRKPV